MTETNALSADTATTVQRAMALARQGDIAGACRAAEQGLAEGGDAAPLNAMLGMLHCRAGALDIGVSHLAVAHAACPDDMTVASNLTAALIELGRAEEALRVTTRDLAMADPTLRLARFRGYLAQLGEDFPAAVEAYEHVVGREPNDWESWNNLGNARSGAGDFDGAVVALEQAAKLNPQSPPTRLNLAQALAAAGRRDDAEVAFEAAAAEFPQDAKPLIELAALRKLRGREEDALDALERAAARSPDDADLLVQLGMERFSQRKLTEVERAFDAAIALDPAIADAHLGLAMLYEHMNREDDFAVLAANADSRGVEAEAVDFIRAYGHRRARRFAEGLEVLDRVPPTLLPVGHAQLKGQLLDRVGETDAAFFAFIEMNRLLAEDPSEPRRRAAEHRASLREERANVTPDWFAGWPKADPKPARPSPVFLVGFPRSGTTLLDTMLMGHPGVQVLEEKPPLGHVQHKIGGIDALPAMNEAAIANARHQYWTEAAQHVDLRPDSLLVDKNPLLLNKVPLIHRIFPDARFIFALRHPCDVLLSCYITSFRQNNAMVNFLDLADAAEMYDLTFSYWEQARGVFPIKVHTVVYERLVEDSARELRPLIDFMGLEWRDELLDHRMTAATRGLITTASYAQVIEPIYTRSAGRWTRYRDQLTPVLPTLAPWVEKFGYSLDDGTIPPWPAA